MAKDEYDILLSGASLRGEDGVGVSVITDSVVLTKKWIGTYKSQKEEILDFVFSNMSLNSILLVNCRATPETELTTSIEMLQPIINDNMVLVHNGGVTDIIHQELESKEYEFITSIDSECILQAYKKYGYNIKNTMEYLVGSFAFVLVDLKKNKIYAVTSFNPLAHMYIRGYGYFLHSDNECLGQILESLTGQTQDGVNVWESWYHHYLDGYTIIETDLQSGFQFKQNYEPRFLHPVWNKNVSDKKEKVLVVASGGIDSGLTSYVLKKVGYDVEMIHFLYGQKSQECELWAVKKLGEQYSIPVRIIDLRPFYSSLPEKGMLTSDDVEIQSGGNLIKSTIAWCSNRNAVFATMTITIAESMITSNEAEKVFISAGWYQLSEETGSYPDNSFKFNEALSELKKYSCITGCYIYFLPVMQRITKTEEWVLGSTFDFPFHYTVSCDSPQMVDGVPHLCTECGSTKLSILASDRANVLDHRKFVVSRPQLSKPMLVPNVTNIIERLVLPEDKKEVLKNLIKG